MIFEDILSTLTIAELRKHLVLYSNLYVHPIKSWKKAISNRTIDNELLTLHIVYYIIFLILVLSNNKISLNSILLYVFLEIIITILPFTILLPGFLLFKSLYKLKRNWYSLFKILLVVKFQFLPIALLLQKTIEKVNIEVLYLIVDNFNMLIFVTFIIAFPIVSNLTVIRKILWILLNYILFTIFIGAFVLIILKCNFQFGNNNYSLLYLTPSNEIRGTIYRPLSIYDKKYLVHFKKISDTTCIIQKTQFVSIQLCSNFYTSISKKDKNIIFPYLDSYKRINDYQINSLIEESEIRKYSARFQSNRIYFENLNLFLKEYYKSYIDTSIQGKFYANSIKTGQIYTDSIYFIQMLDIDTNFYQTRKKFRQTEKLLVQRDFYSTLLIRIIFYPFYIILDFIGFI